MESFTSSGTWPSANPFEAEGLDHLCGDCLKRPKAFRKLFTGGAYTGTLKDLIHFSKFSEREESLRPLIRFFLQQEHCDFDPGAYDLWLCIPTTSKHLRQRGIHLAARIMQSLSKVYRGQSSLKALVKIRDTEPQFSLKGEARWKNVRGAFQVNSEVIEKAQKVLLVDDVYTTGATVHEAAKTLKKEGVQEVDVLTLARGV